MHSRPTRLDDRPANARQASQIAEKAGCRPWIFGIWEVVSFCLRMLSTSMELLEATMILLL